MNIEDRKLSEIRPYANNPRNNADAVAAVAKSIETFGFKVPIVIDKTGEIVAGHTRYKAAKRLKLTTVPCVIADDLTEEQIKAFRLADNKTGELATWNDSLLQLELADIINIDMADFGFTDEDLLNPETVVEDDFNFEPPTDPIAKPGQIWALGNSRLMCGDSGNPADVARLMAGQLADLVVTDPPYNVDIHSRGKNIQTINNDDMADGAFREFLLGCFTCMAESLKPGGAFYIWHASRSQRAFEDTLEAVGLQVRQQLIWNKTPFVMGRQDYHWKHEPCFYGWQSGAAHYFIDDRTGATIQETGEAPDIESMKKGELLALARKMLAAPTTVMEEDKPSVADLHPTMKPIKLMARHIRNSSRVGEIVLDLFGGSGSTLMAAEQLNRKCYMMEFDPRYADVIIQRWEEFTGEQAELIEEGASA